MFDCQALSADTIDDAKKRSTAGVSGEATFGRSTSRRLGLGQPPEATRSTGFATTFNVAASYFCPERTEYADHVACILGI